MQIESLIFYNSKGEKRILPFKTGKVNIITGESKTGKTAIIDIVNYCLGSNECNISQGIIRDVVEWFAIRLQFPSEQVFIARQNPSKLGVASTQSIFYSNADTVEIPELVELVNNSDTNTLKEFLTKKLSIAEFIHKPTSGTRDDLAVNFKHSRLYSFQPQDLIAQRNFLFYNQTDNFVAQSIKDTLPYFLGAIREDAIRIEQELAGKKRELNKLVKELKEYERLKDDGQRKIYELVEEAKQLNLLPTQKLVENPTQALEALTEVLNWGAEKEEVEGENENLKKLIDEKNEFTKRLGILNDDLKAVTSFVKDTTDYSGEATQQKARLESVRLFGETEAGLHSCPLCTQDLKSEIPSISAINKSLEDLSNNLQTTIAERPKLNQYVEKLNIERDTLKKKIEIRQNGVKAIYLEQEAASKQKDQNLRRGKVIGKTTLFLESYKAVEDDAALKKSIQLLEGQIFELEEKVGAEEKENRLNSILNQINIQMSSWVKGLDLEHQDAPIRFDIKKLTIYADTPTKSIQLSQMGSGANWVAYHLLIHFALHKHFIQANRPVPRFLILDQPSQVYYPPEKDLEQTGEIAVSTDEQAVKQMFDFILKITEELSPNFQVIITDHAKLNDDVFKDAICEEWRNGLKLIPESWRTE
ncbi:MAG: DUF3732 domain-containing protein [Saprospiraceae bacterium]|nr:DUF3732 domain-containing protein [Saprospiraceae bacterium]